MSREKNSTLVNEHSWNREPVPLTWDQALLLLLLFFVSLAREGKNNACYIHITSRQPLPRLHNLTSAWPVILLANQHLPDGNQILARKSLLKSKNADWNQHLMDGGILANRNSANHPHCFLSSQKKVQIVAFLHVICQRIVSCPPSENRLKR